MATLNARDIRILEQPPVRSFEFRDVKIRNSVFRVYEDGGVWDIMLGRWRVPYIDADGYRIHHIGGYTVKLHRLVLTVFQRAPTHGEQGRHLDGDPSNNYNSNLAWGTGKQNWVDRKLHGRIGAEWRRLLTKDQALSIFNDPRPDTDIAIDHGIQRICVSLIKEKLTYRDIHGK